VRCLNRLLAAGLLFGLALADVAPVRADTVYSDRAAFEATLANRVIDDYEHPGYAYIQDDATMSAVLGETDYTATGWEDNNIVTPVDDGSGYTSSNVYCTGCNGSFLLSFATTSVGTANGVFGAGFEFFNAAYRPYHAFVTFGDGTTQDIALAPAGSGAMSFFGITSASQISSIHVGLQGGAKDTAGYFGIDNLTLGSSAVPVPPALYLFVSGLLLLGRFVTSRS
jgi:hypothetical protein